MGRPKGSKGKKPNRYWSKEDKYDFVKLIVSGEYSTHELGGLNDVSSGMLRNWVKRYLEGGIEALENKRKPGNPLVKYQKKKILTAMEKLQYENMKLRIENERLKKGYTTEEVRDIRQKRSSKKNTKS